MASDDKNTILQDIGQIPNVKADAQLLARYGTGTKRKLTFTYEEGKKVMLDYTPVIHKPTTLSQPPALESTDIKREETLILADDELLKENILADDRLISQPNAGTRKKRTMSKAQTKTTALNCNPNVQNSCIRAEPALAPVVDVNAFQNERTLTGGRNLSQPITGAKDNMLYIMLGLELVTQRSVQPSQTVINELPSKPIHTLSTESPSSSPIQNIIQSSTSAIAGKSVTIPARQMTHSVSPNPPPVSENAAGHKEVVEALNNLAAVVNKLGAKMDKEINELKKDMYTLYHEHHKK